IPFSRKQKIPRGSTRFIEPYCGIYMSHHLFIGSCFTHHFYFVACLSQRSGGIFLPIVSFTRFKRRGKTELFQLNQFAFFRFRISALTKATNSPTGNTSI